ncbi:Pyruvate/Phosphoenolpyruvate kinase-like domain-containing protein [Chytridium lagenaria]|nr:Pyruvate/Phosphoenolpyruvate kinase-like domain-containing protein [Chytridium lagenaria]
MRRSILYIPGSDERKVKKALQLTADQVDCVVFDLEDSVTTLPVNKSTTPSKQSFPNPTTKRCVRINGNNFIGKQDLDAILPLPNLQSILIPKVNSASDIHFVEEAIHRHLSINPALSKLKLLASIESAQGVVNAEKIATCSDRVDSLVFAAEDYCADVGLIRSPGRQEMVFARQKIVTVAKAYGLQAIDLVCVEFKKEDVLKEECNEGRSFGFTGKQAIHPAQSIRFKLIFFQIIDGYEAYKKEGKGAFNLDGKMIDMPVVKWALKILAQRKA